ncbi:MAG: hypothetical protein GY762_09385 [Proteobacteria bacterium]|nr:hypothetical protein [Pseudomonadota bacterium]
MSSKVPIWRWRLFLFWLSVVVVAGLIACAIRPLKTLGYEYALFISLFSSLGAGHLAACYPARIRNQLARFPGARFPAIVMAYRALTIALPLVILPLCIALLNGFIEPPCNQLEGFQFYLAMPVCSIVIAVTIGLVAGLVTPGAITASILWFILFAATFAGAIYSFYSTPAVYVFGPLFGYFPGVLYDELVHFEVRLVTYRVVTLVQSTLLLAVMSWLLDPATLKLSLRRFFGRPKAGLTSFVLLIAVALAYLSGPYLGHRTTRENIEKSLNYTVSDGKLDLFFPSDTNAQLVSSLFDDAVFSLHQVEQYLNLQANKQIAIFFFKNSDHKSAAMGAGKTSVAKPWRREIYVTIQKPPHTVLRHELVHALTARLGQGPFAVAGRLNGYLPNPALIEGIAVAAGGPTSDLTIHQWAAAMKKLELLPDLSSLFGLGFLGRNASSAYTAAGSFCDWIHGKFGAAALKQAYRTGSFEQATHRNVDELEKGWHRFLNTTTLVDEDMAAARHRFDRPAPLKKVCVHEVARLIRKAGHYANMQQWDNALRLYTEAYEKSGGASHARMRRFYALVDSGKTASMKKEAMELLVNSSLNRVQKDAVQEVLADNDVTAARFQEAKRSYADLALTAPNENRRRTLEVKTHLADLEDNSLRPLFQVLARRPAPHGAWQIAAALTISAAAYSHPDDPLFAYLLARQYFNARDYNNAIRWLEKATHLGLEKTTLSLWLAARMLRGQAQFYSGDFRPAEAQFRAVEQDKSLRPGARDIARDWKERSAFFED